MKNRLRGLGNKKQIEVAAMAETFEHEGVLLQKVVRAACEGDYIRPNQQIDNPLLNDGEIYGPVKLIGGNLLVGSGPYNLYQKNHNRTTDSVEVFEVVGEVATSRIHEKINNAEHYLLVESNYRNPTEGKDAKDAVLFQTGQVAKGTEEIDSCVIVSVDFARSFAQGILDVCRLIEEDGELPQVEAEPKCTITLLEKEHLPGAFIVEVLTPECKRTIHHYSDKSRTEYVDDLVRQLELSGVSYVVNKSEGGK